MVSMIIMNYSYSEAKLKILKKSMSEKIKILKNYMMSKSSDEHIQKKIQ